MGAGTGMTTRSTITRDFYFEMGHSLADHPGKCRRLHGHSYHLQISIEGRLNDQGMVMDFSDLKTVVNRILDRYDHMFMIHIFDPRADDLLRADSRSLLLVGFKPTAENICQEIKGEIEHELPVPLMHARLWETHDSYAEC